MKRVFQILFISSLLFSCNSTKRVVLGEELITYKAAGNDMASIDLKFYDSNKFVFEFTSFSPEKKSKDKGVTEIGTYSEDSDWYILHFSKESEWNLKDLFDEEVGVSDVYLITDPHTLKLRKGLDFFYVWGILLEKQ